MNASNTIRLLIFAAGFACTLAPARAGDWWNRAWSDRVGVTFPPARRGENPAFNLPGEDVAVVTFYHGGKLAADGKDLRVVTSRNQLVPHRILQLGPGDRCRIAFALRKDVQKYYVYFGNENAPPPDKPLEIHRGVLLETWAYAGGQANTLTEAKKTFERAQAKPPLGAGFVDDIFQGYNPLGPEQRIVARYTAWIVAPKAGEYQFATSSMNASFLWVDDRLIVNNAGWHGPQYQVVKRGPITLSAGVHKLMFVQICPWGDPIAVVVCQPPGLAWSRIDPAAFTPVRQGIPSPMEQRNHAINIDFLVSPGGEVFCSNRYYQRREFVARTIGRGGRGVKWRWDFGDGLTGEGENPQHVYLTPGVYTITLTATGLSARPLTISHRVDINRPWDRLAVNRLERVRDYAEIVAGYDLAKLSPAANAEAAVLFQRAKDDANLLHACDVFLQRSKADPASLQIVLTMYVDTLLATGKPDDARKAADALRKAATMTDQPAVATDMQLWAAKILADNVNAPDEAMSILQRLLEQANVKTNPALLRRVQIAQGDTWRVKGDHDQALQAYSQAGVVDARAKEHPAIVRGDFARQAEAYLNTRDYSAAAEAIDRWEQTFPADQLEGYTTLLRVELLLAQKNYPAAARQAEALANVSPRSPYAPDILMQAYLAYKAAGQAEQAKRTLQRLAADYRESPLSQKAKQLLR